MDDWYRVTNSYNGSNTLVLTILDDYVTIQRDYSISLENFFRRPKNSLFPFLLEPGLTRLF